MIVATGGKAFLTERKFKAHWCTVLKMFGLKSSKIADLIRSCCSESAIFCMFQDIDRAVQLSAF